MKKHLLFFLLLLDVAALGQGAFIPPQTAFKVVNGYTTPIANATITVCAANAGGIPCSPALVSTIFKDAALTQALSNPFTTDAFGNYQFAAAQGTYTVTTTAAGFAGYSAQFTLGGGGISTGVTSFSAGTFSPLFTTSVATPTTTPALTFNPSNFAANTALANLTGGAAAPTATAVQGTDPKLLSVGQMGIAGATLCQSANNGASTVGCTSPFVSGLPTAGLLAEYRFNEGSGTSLTDYTGNGNTGTFCASAPAWTAGDVNAGLAFDGISQCVNLPAALNSARTIIMVTQAPTPAGTAYHVPVCGSTGNNFGTMWLGTFSTPTSGGGEYLLTGWSQSVGSLFLERSSQPAGGTQINTWTMGSAGDGTFDRIWTNDSFYPFVPVEPPLVNNVAVGTSAQSAGQQTTGHYVIGGSAAGACMTGFPSWWQGTMLELVFYSTYLTQVSLGQAYSVIGANMGQRGRQITPVSGALLTTGNNQYVALGDSITYGTNTTTSFPQFMAFNNTQATWNWLDIALPGIQARQELSLDSYPNRIASAIYPNGANFAASLWEGTNDCNAGATTPQQTWANLVGAARSYRSHMFGPSQKLIGATMISRTADDTCKNQLNALIRAQWPTVFDALEDMGADLCFGADSNGGNTNCFSGDGTHPSTPGQANNAAPIAQRAVRRVFGNQNWTSANTYTTAALGTTATTAGSEATNTVTITFGATPANCVVGSQITIAGVTPAGYNSGTIPWNILTRTATQITFQDYNSGLGVITVQGTGICPQQVDEDVYAILGGSAAGNPSFLLESCIGYTGQNLYFKNTNTTSAWVLTPFLGAETIDGAPSLTMPTASSGNNPVVILQDTLISAAAAGCTWKRMQ